MVIVLLALVVVLVGWFFTSIATRHGKAKVTLVALPKDSVITIDGQRSQAGDVYLKPGSHTFIAAKDGFTDAKKILKTQKGEKQVVYLLPIPSSQKALEYLASNPNIQAQREAVGGQEDTTITKETTAQSPIIKLLPFTDIYGPFSIDYGTSHDRVNGTYLTVSDSSPNGRAKALQWIREQGYDPTSLEIQFSDFDNPLIITGEIN
jgi:hypothetical protein